MKSAYQIIRRPVITEKGLAIKENQNTLVFQVAPGATKTEVKQAVQTIFKVKVMSVRTAMYPGKRTAAGQVCRLPSRLEEGVCATACRREDAGVRAEFVKVARSIFLAAGVVRNDKRRFELRAKSS
jgi:large subunit ribosomal protein L23